jgi:hypothetical protein
VGLKFALAWNLLGLSRVDERRGSRVSTALGPFNLIHAEVPVSQEKSSMDALHLIFQISWPGSRCRQAAQSPAGAVVRSVIFHRNPDGAQMRKRLAHLPSTPPQPGFYADLRDTKDLCCF